MQDQNKARSLFFRHLAPTSPEPLALHFERAEGSTLFSADGTEYLDMISGISVSNLGHNHPEINKAVINQVEKHSHLMVYGEFIQDVQVSLAHLLAENLGEGFESVYFVNSGAEAVEGSMKLAKRYTGRHEIVSCRNAYHGSTHGAMSIMGSETYKTSFRPLLPGTRLIRFNNIEDLQKISSETACVIIEPVQAEAGVIVPEQGYLQALRKRCNECGTLLIFDEIQTGFGRTGSLFAFQKYGVKPDVIMLAKALGGGYPLGAFISSSQIMKSLSNDPILGHITTFGGHPVSCAAAKASLEIISMKGFLQEVNKKAALFKELFSELPEGIHFNQSGLLMAIHLQEEKQCFDAISKSIQEKLITDWFLFASNAIRLAPPLIIKEEEIRHACRIILNAIK
ncbi:MAG: aspartate aminotransferase family protein [Marinilabiliales bacterium]|nr:MAG: aspartate aminotransferase family protein [Marinilabiliales bacterium]